MREARRNYGRPIVERLKELNIKRVALALPVSAKSKARARPRTSSFTAPGNRSAKPFRLRSWSMRPRFLDEVRYVKSKEIDVLPNQIEINEIAIQAEIDAAKVGVKDWTVWAAVHYAMTRNGSELPIHYSGFPGKTPSAR